jgi:hypothetical protein
MTTLRELPAEIVAAVVEHERRMDYPDFVPTYAEVPHPDGVTRFKHRHSLTVADCEQLVEFHTRRARSAITTWDRTRSRQAAGKAGKNILYARLYRCLYMTLTGVVEVNEADMPFPIQEHDQ